MLFNIIGILFPLCLLKILRCSIEQRVTDAFIDQWRARLPSMQLY